METKTKLSLETDLDKGLETLANTKAYCIYCRNNNICSKADCATCKKQLYYDASVRNLLPIDLLKIDDLAFVKLQQYLKGKRFIAKKERSRNLFESVRIIITIFLIVSIMPLLFILLMIGMSGDNPPYFYTKEYNTITSYQREYVEHVLDLVHYNIYDVNNDRKINCQDYAVLFKYYWDKEYPNQKNFLEVTHNLNNSTGMNHVFVTLHAETRDYYIEPQGSKEEYMMYRIWGNKFNPGYNGKMSDRDIRVFLRCDILE